MRQIAVMVLHRLVNGNYGVRRATNALNGFIQVCEIHAHLWVSFGSELPIHQRLVSPRMKILPGANAGLALNASGMEVLNSSLNCRAAWTIIAVPFNEKR